MTFGEKLDGVVGQNNSLLCIGIDPVVSKLPESIQGDETPLYTFGRKIVDATADLVCAYKPNSAFYEALGTVGINQLAQTCDYIREKHPLIPIILDAKRADIGNTNDGYVKSAFDGLGADAITLHPYLGREALGPFLARKDKGMIILCRTSNPGAGEFQDLLVDGKPLYEHIAQQVSRVWNVNDNCLLVVGATYPEEMKTIRKIAGPDMVFLVPGIGAQGGDVEAVMEAGLGANNRGLIISSSREIIYASSGEDFAEAARAKAQATRDEINKYRKLLREL